MWPAEGGVAHAAVGRRVGLPVKSGVLLLSAPGTHGLNLSNWWKQDT